MVRVSVQVFVLGKEHIGPAKIVHRMFVRSFQIVLSLMPLIFPHPDLVQVILRNSVRGRDLQNCFELFDRLI